MISIKTRNNTIDVPRYIIEGYKDGLLNLILKNSNDKNSIYINMRSESVNVIIDVLSDPTKYITIDKNDASLISDLKYSGYYEYVTSLYHKVRFIDDYGNYREYDPFFGTYDIIKLGAINTKLYETHDIVVVNNFAYCITKYSTPGINEIMNYIINLETSDKIIMKPHTYIRYRQTMFHDNGHIYVCGGIYAHCNFTKNTGGSGFNHSIELVDDEYYDIKEQTWHTIKHDRKCAMWNVKCVIFNDQIITLSGLTYRDESVFDREEELNTKYLEDRSIVFKNEKYKIDDVEFITKDDNNLYIFQYNHNGNMIITVDKNFNVYTSHVCDIGIRYLSQTRQMRHYKINDKYYAISKKNDFICEIPIDFTNYKTLGKYYALSINENT